MRLVIQARWRREAWSLAASMLWMSAESDFTCSSAWLRASASVGVARPLVMNSMKLWTRVSVRFSSIFSRRSSSGTWANRSWEGLPHELRERGARPGAYASSAAKASDLDRGAGCSAALGVQCCSCFERRQPARSSCARKTSGCATAASTAELRYPCAPPLLLTRGGRKP